MNQNKQRSTSRSTRWQLLAGVSLIATSASLSSIDPAFAQACTQVPADTTIITAQTVPCVIWTGSDLTITSNGVVGGPSTTIGVDAILTGGQTLTNAGQIIADSTSEQSSEVIFVGVMNRGGLMGSLSNTGTIRGSGNSQNVGQTVAGVANIAGTIISLYNSETIMAAGVAADETGIFAAVYNTGVISTLTNASTGTILSEADNGLYDIAILNAASGSIGILSNEGIISGGSGIISSGSIGSLTNSGQITATRGGSVALGVMAGVISGATNNGTISSNAGAAVATGPSATITNFLNTALIVGVTGINNSGVIGTLTNSGTIRGGSSGSGGTGVLSNGGRIGELNNSGTISGDLNGVVSVNSGSIGTLHNSGRIITAGSTGFVSAYDSTLGALSNSGLIQGKKAGIANALSTIAVNSITNESGGTIRSFQAEATGSGQLLGGLLNVQSTINSLTNQVGAAIIGGGGLTVGSSNVLAGVLNAGGVIGSLSNSGDIHATAELVAGPRQSVFGVGNLDGTITTLTNAGVIYVVADTGSSTAIIAGVFNSGTISALENLSGGTISSTVTGGGRGNGVFNRGNIETLHNFADAVISADTGIGVRNFGGIGTLTNAGLISSNSGTGISVEGGSVRTLTNSGTISSYSSGVYLEEGSISVLSNSGLISTANGDGIRNFGGSINTISNTGVISGWTYGIRNSGTVDFIENVGSVSGGTLAGGIITAGSTTAVYNAGGTIGTIINSGLLSGYGGFANEGNLTLFQNDALYDGSALVGGIVRGNSTTAFYNTGSIGTLTNSGLITGPVGLASEGTITSLTNTGTIEGTSGYGISTSGLITSLRNIGTIDGVMLVIGTISSGSSSALNNTGSIGSVVNSGVISGSDGIFNSGNIDTLENNAFNAEGALVGGLISATGTGVYNTGTIGTLTNSGEISGNLGVANYGQIDTFNNSGKVTADYSTGVYTSGTILTLINTGQIDSAYRGLYNSGGFIQSVNNSGTIIGASSVGLYNYSGTIESLVNSGTIQGYYGLYNYYLATIGTVNNSGLILGTSGTALVNYEGTTIGSLTNTGTISSPYRGVYNGLSDALIETFINEGVIEGGGQGIWNDAGGTILSLSNSNLISSASGTAIKNSGSIGTLTNTGTVIDGIIVAGFITGGTSGIGILNAGTILSLLNTGLISGGIGIENDQYIGTLDNSGRILGITSAAVYNYANTIASLLNTGIIQGNDGIRNYYQSTILTLNNSGLISADNVAIYNDETSTIGTIINSGQIISGYRGIYNVYSDTTIEALNNTVTGTIKGGTGQAIYNYSGVILSILNEGQIISTAATAILNQNYIGTLTNSGTIDGNSGVFNDGGLIDTIINSGLILSRGSASALSNWNNGTIGTLTNEGQIISNAYYAINNNGSTIDVFSNSGTIQGRFVGIYNNNGGVIASLDNSNLIQAVTGTAIANGGLIGTLTNSGLIQGAIAIYNYSSGTLTTIINSGTIAGAINNASAENLTIVGGSGSAFGTLTGAGATLDVADMGQISNTGSDLVFSGNVLLNDNIDVTGFSVFNTGATISLANDVTVLGAYNQSGGMLDLGGKTITQGSVVFSGGTITAGLSVSQNDFAQSGGVLNADVSAAAYNYSGGTVNSGTITASNSLAFNTTDATISSVLAGTASLFKSDTTTLTLTGTNTYLGNTFVLGGILKITNGSALGATSAFNNAAFLNAGATLQLEGGIAVGNKILALNGTGAALGALESVSGDNSWAGLVAVQSNTRISVDAGSLTLSGPVLQLGSDPLGFDIVGAGTLVVSGYGGAATIDDTAPIGGAITVTGTKLVLNGWLGGPTSTLAVSGGATLAGWGTFGGSVSITDGILAPGNSPGTLTIDGSLTLASNSILNFEFGQANTVGGSLNDLVIVHGDLTLAGTLNVTQSEGGTFGAGVYRVISYDGDLTNQGLVLGTMPTGSTTFIQVAVPGQINLVNTDGQSLSYWDGSAGPKNNGVVNGGDGIWTNMTVGPQADNWTTASGAVNGPYAAGTFAVFMGAPGTVTVDSESGPVVVTGMQFAVDGYNVSDGTIVLAAESGQTVIRVGDGTVPGGAYHATIGSVLAGTSGLNKTDRGQLILTGENTYTGNTTISQGVLGIGDGGTTGSVQGDIVNNAILNFNRSNDISYAGVISGTGRLFKNGAGTLTLTGTNSFSGATSVVAGRLLIGGGSSLSDTALVTVFSGATLELMDTDETVGALSGAGAVVLNSYCLIVAGGLTSSYSGNMSGSGCLAVTGTGTQTLAGPSEYTGGTTISDASTVVLGSSGALGTGNVALQDAGVLRSSGTYVYGNTFSLAAGLTGGFSVDEGEILTLTGTISGDGDLNKTGTGTLLIGGTNTYNGATNVNAGILNAVGGNALSDTGAVNIAAGAQLLLQEGTETVGSIAGTGAVVLDGASLITGGNNASTTFGGAISGTGGLTKTGTGALTLAGDSTYTGPTLVAGGNLIVNGSLTGSPVTVGEIGTLSGGGTITELVSVQSGGTLAGVQGTVLTMGGLDLASGANVNVTLGAPSGSAMFNVTGDLTLAGTLNVTATTGFGLGVYRIMNYSGMLTNNGMEVGNVPEGYAGGIQTSINNQVNLFIDSPNGPIAFWNGTTLSPTGTVVGGDGVWQANTQTNWTNANGTISRTWNSGFAVFQGDAGLVTVDSSLGQVSAAGMQFVTSGYVVSGASITLAGATPAVIRVGDGTVDGTSTVATIASELTGTSGLEKADFGKLILTAANSYTGGTTISGGTLQLGNNGTSGSVLGDIVNNAALAFNRSDDITFAAVISGTGSVLKTGAGTLALTGVNTYSGGTAITGGTLQVTSAAPLGTGNLTVGGSGILRASGTFTYGNGVTLGLPLSESAPMAPSRVGTFEVDASQALTLSGVVSGSSGLVKIGEGLLILTGTNTYTGVTTISDGTLQIGNGGTTGAISGDVVNNANLVFNRSDTYTFTGAITGNGAVTFMGGGTVEFSAPYTGPITVDNSFVQLQQGSTTTSPFTVNDGGVLGGTATIGSLTVNSGGTVAPGYSPGTLTVSGPVTFNSGSVYAVDVTPSGAHDLILATGNVTLSSGATVQVLAVPGRYPAESMIPIITTTGTVSGTFGGVTSDYAFLQPELGYDLNNVYLVLTYTGVDFVYYAQTPNQVNVAVAAQTLGGGNPVFDALMGLSVGAVAPALNQLSGEIYPSVNTVIQQETNYLRDAVGTRLRQSVTPQGNTALSYAAKAAGPATAKLSQDLTPTLWMQGYGGWGNAFGNTNAASISSTIGGFFAGVDVGVLDNVRVGVVAGFSQTQFDVDARNSSGSMDNYDIGLYAGGQFGAWALRGGASYTWHDISVTRSVVFPGFSGATNGGYNVGTTQVFGEVGYDFSVGSYAFEPFAGFAYVNISGGSLTEGGLLSSGAGLNVNTNDQNTFYTTLGVRAATSFMLGGRALTPSATLGWQHAFGDTTPTANMLFQGGATPFQVSGVPIAENTLLMGAGLAYALSDLATLQVNYVGQIASEASQNAFTAQFSLKF